ncbi:MAG: monofunctional biosynthetic peptidoglycan transglycosylase [Burkholderiales bacterium]|nr:monofunctional biosynthetic peptidoglycan transglycosylase [Burkholderiales bacterium]
MRRYLWRGLLLAVVLVLAYELAILGCITWWVWFNPSSTRFMEDRLAAMQQQDPAAELKHEWVPYDRISIQLKRAIIASEDAKFLDHDGFDWDAIQKAYTRNLKKGKVVSGGSTISQQLAKNLFLTSQRTPWRKAQEAIITVMLEKVMTKRRILEIYLNVIEWGDGVFGAEAAARHYYKVPASKLGAEQAARLAAIVPNPRFYDKHRGTQGIRRKMSVILVRMPAAVVP